MKEKIINSKFKLLNYTLSPKKVLLHPLFSGSFFMVVGSNIANFTAYIFHLVLGRVMGPSSYGELVATISIITLIMSIISFFGLVIVKFVSSAKSGEISNILGWFNRKTVRVAILVSVVVLFASPFIGRYIHLQAKIYLLFSPILFFSVISYVYKSFMQGTVKFKEMAIVANTELLTRLIFALLFVFLGMSVFGATLGILVSTICGLFLARYYLRNIRFNNKIINGFNWKNVTSYALPVFVVSISFTSLLTMDIVMVKHFFSSHDAGIYGAISNLGKIIFYGSAPINSVMFPLISKRKSQKTGFLNIFKLSIVLVFLIGIGILTLYYIFPTTAIKILYGSEYIEGKRYLLLMGVYYIFYSISGLFSSFLLSIDRTKAVLILPIFACIQIMAIYLFHSTIWSVIGASILSISLLLLYLGLYFVYEKGKIV